MGKKEYEALENHKWIRNMRPSAAKYARLRLRNILFISQALWVTGQANDRRKEVQNEKDSVNRDRSDFIICRGFLNIL